jgi:hypothetical protein
MGAFPRSKGYGSLPLWLGGLGASSSSFKMAAIIKINPETACMLRLIGVALHNGDISAWTIGV